VAVNANVTLHFSKTLNPLTVTTGPAGTILLTANSVSIAPSSISYTSPQDLIISPYGMFPDNSQITVTATAGIQDLSGNPLAIPFTSTFTTRTGAAVTGGMITSLSPANGAQNVPLNVTIQATSDTAVDPGPLSTYPSPLADIDSGITPVPGNWSLSPDGKLLTFAPTSNLTASHRFQFGCPSVLDINGDYLNCQSLTSPEYNYIAYFTTASALAPTTPAVTASNPPNGLNGVPTNILVQVLFSESILPTSLTGVTLTPAGASPLALTTALSNANQTLTLVPPGLLEPSSRFTLYIAGITDLEGHGLASPVTQTFTTGPGVVLAAPTATPLNLTDQATGVSTTIIPSATISATINPLTLTAGAFFVASTYPYVQPIAGTLALQPDGVTITFTPTSPLTPNTAYQLTVPNGVLTDLAGNGVIGFAITFYTGN
jgi:hypothetical protein